MLGRDLVGRGHPVEEAALIAGLYRQRSVAESAEVDARASEPSGIERTKRVAHRVDCAVEVPLGAYQHAAVDTGESIQRAFGDGDFAAQQRGCFDVVE